MKQEIIYNTIENILDNWNPIGVWSEVLLRDNNTDTSGEYRSYIRPIINVYLSNQSMYDYLIELNTALIDYPNDEMRKEIQLISERIIEFLSKCTKEDLQKTL